MELPSAFKEYLVQLAIGEESGPCQRPPLHQRQRDLLPLPMICFEDDELPRRDSYAEGCGSLCSARYAWTMLMLASVNCEYHLGVRSAAKVKMGPPSAVQYEAVRRLAVAADIMCALNPQQVGERDWEFELNKCRIAYDGTAQYIAQKVTARQVAAGLPPQGLAASVNLLDLVDEVTRAALLDPMSVRLPDEEVTGSWARPRFQAVNAAEEKATKILLYQS